MKKKYKTTLDESWPARDKKNKAAKESNLAYDTKAKIQKKIDDDKKALEERRIKINMLLGRNESFKR